MASRVRRSARGTVAAAHGVTAAAAARVGAAAVRGMTATARARVVRELTDEAVILIRSVRMHFEREMEDTRRILLKKPAKRTAVATGLSRCTASRVSASGAAERTRPAGTLERRKYLRRIPLEEYTRVRAAIYQQYRYKMLPTLDSSLHVLTACQEGAAGSGAVRCEQSGENLAMDAGGSRAGARAEDGAGPMMGVGASPGASAGVGIGKAGAVRGGARGGG